MQSRTFRQSVLDELEPRRGDTSMCEVTLSNPTAGRAHIVGRSSRRSRCRYGCPPPHHTRARRRSAHICTRDIHMQLTRRHDKTRANEGQKSGRGNRGGSNALCRKYRPGTEKAVGKNQKRRGGGEGGEREREELSSRYCCTVQYSVGAVAAAGVLVAAMGART